MIQHIVFWKLADQAGGHDKETNYRLLKEKLEALKAYDSHPAHQAVRAFIKTVRIGRTCLDFEMD